VATALGARWRWEICAAQFAGLRLGAPAGGAGERLAARARGRRRRRVTRLVAGSSLAAASASGEHLVEATETGECLQMQWGHAARCRRRRASAHAGSVGVRHALSCRQRHRDAVDGSEIFADVVVVIRSSV
jgi:hypothetical protein